MSERIISVFNQSAANKIIKQSELQEKLAPLYQKEMTSGEKFYMSTLGLVDRAKGFMNMLVEVAQPGVIPESLRREAKNGALIGYDGDHYMSEKTMAMLCQYNLGAAFNKNICEKYWKLKSQAAEQCADYRGTRVVSTAQPMFLPPSGKT